jgi:hypothetical protein
MENSSQSRETVRFGVFELDLRAGELRKQGLKVRLQEKPFQVLALLLERPGELVTRELKSLSRRRQVKDLDFAFVHLGLGDKEEALRGLERASTEGEGWVSYFNADPIYDPLRSDPRFQSLLARVGARGLSREKGQ